MHLISRLRLLQATNKLCAIRTQFLTTPTDATKPLPKPTQTPRHPRTAPGGISMGSALGAVRSETPAHTVLLQAQGYEIWRYPSSVSAVVHISDLRSNATNAHPQTDRAFRNAAFGALARYIGVFSTPHNEILETKQPRKIAMTAPVVMQPVDRRGDFVCESMKFLLPAKYKRVQDAPVPTNPAVKLQIEPEGRVVAVLAFSGDLDMNVAAERAAELADMLRRDALQPKGHWIACGYNPPFTPPKLKRNEVHFPLDSTAFEDGAP